MSDPSGPDWRAMPDREIEVNGGIVVYEFVGPEDGEVVVVTPGGRFSKDFGGVHELADALAEGGKRVLLWDRPNCGKSDVHDLEPEDMAALSLEASAICGIPLSGTRKIFGI